MKITNITVHAGRTFNHPHESYSNLKPEVILSASIEEGESAVECAKKLQAQAEQLVEDHKQNLLKSIDELHCLTERQAEVRGLQKQLEMTQARLNEIRVENPALAMAT